MKIGDTIWRFNENRRVYPPKEPGRMWSSGGPIYREHWEALKIVGETSRSWLTERGYKCPKSGDRRGWALTQKELDDDVFVNEHRHKITQAVGRINDADELRKVANLIGYGYELHTEAVTEPA